MEHFLYICIRKPTKQHTVMAKKTEPTVEDLFNEMTRKANVSKQTILKNSMKRWIMNNLDLLTPAELEKYEHLFAK